MIDQSEEGVDFIPGVSAYTYEGNLKLQLENCSDGYHVSSVHPTYLELAQRRTGSDRGNDLGGVYERTMGATTGGDVSFGTFQFPHGHAVTWATSPATAAHPLFHQQEELVRRVGETRARWMFYSRNVTIYPNLQIVDNFSSQLRIIRPLSPGRTEMVTYCIGPQGEASDARRQRLRQYEDFFMPSGLATPDDLVVYEDCQEASVAAATMWQGYDRGMAVLDQDESPEALALGIRPSHWVRGTGQLSDETVFHTYYRTWQARMGEAGAL